MNKVCKLYKVELQTKEFCYVVAMNTAEAIKSCGYSIDQTETCSVQYLGNTKISDPICNRIVTCYNPKGDVFSI